MVDLKILKERGIDTESLRRYFDLQGGPDFSHVATTDVGRYIVDDSPEGRRNRLKNRIRLRIRRGIDTNVSYHKTYRALDLAWDTPFRQISPTLLQSLVDKNPEAADVKATLSAWGFNLDEVIQETPDPKDPSKNVKRIVAPTFFQVFVPLVRAYVTIRLSKISNDLRQNPFLKYEPAINNAQGRLKSEIMTARVEMMNQQYDYWQVVKQATFQMLHYSRCLMFPVESWHDEKQEVQSGTEGAVQQENGRYVKTVREGMRYHLPHPSRVFVDDAHRPSTYNTDSGCEYAGYWKVVRYGAIRENPNYWNRDKVTLGNTDWWSSGSTQAFFASVYSGCQITFPVPSDASSKDRETRLAENYYTANMEDAPCLITEYFEKLIPSECGLGDYDYPVWFRFLVASDQTIIYAEPLPYSPVIYFGYDADELRTENASLSLEILPFQDQFSLLMSQYLLSVRQNLSNVTFVDTDVVSKEDQKTIKNVGERLFRWINFIPFSGRKALKGQTSVPQAFFSHRFPPLDTNGLLAGMRIILDTLERVLVMSSQEVAQAATHEQTKAEVQNIAASTSTRLISTAIPVIQAMTAMKKQIYQGLMAYGEAEFYVEVPIDQALPAEVLKALGITWEQSRNVSAATDRRQVLRVPKTALLYESFTSAREGYDRVNNVEAGMAMLNTLTGLIQGPLGPSIGPDQALDIVNLSAQLMGYPKDFKLENASQNPEDQAKAAKEQINSMIEEIRSSIQGEVLGEVQQALVPIMEGQQQLDQRVQELQAALARIIQQGQAAPQLQLPASDYALAGP